jgi:hypothetical protein
MPRHRGRRARLTTPAGSCFLGRVERGDVDAGPGRRPPLTPDVAGGARTAVRIGTISTISTSPTAAAAATRTPFPRTRRTAKSARTASGATGGQTSAIGARSAAGAGTKRRAIRHWGEEGGTISASAARPASIRNTAARAAAATARAGDTILEPVPRGASRVPEASFRAGLDAPLIHRLRTLAASRRCSGTACPLSLFRTRACPTGPAKTISTRCATSATRATTRRHRIGGWASSRARGGQPSASGVRPENTRTDGATNTAMVEMEAAERRQLSRTPATALPAATSARARAATTTTFARPPERATAVAGATDGQAAQTTQDSTTALACLRRRPCRPRGAGLVPPSSIPSSARSKVGTSRTFAHPPEFATAAAIATDSQRAGKMRVSGTVLACPRRISSTVGSMSAAVAAAR